MKNRLLVAFPPLCWLLLGSTLCGLAPAGEKTSQANKPQTKETTRLNYPVTRRSDDFDVHHGVVVPDPFRWLEDPNSPETRQWIEQQNKLTFDYLKQIDGRDNIEQRLTKLWNYERWGLPRKRGDRYFVTHNDGLQNQSVLYVMDGLDAEPRLLLDPNTLSEDGTVTLAGWAPSEDGSLLAYGLGEAGSDWRTWKVRDVATGEDRDDLLEWVKFSGVSWTPDGEGFYYSRYDEPSDDEKFTGQNYFQKLYYHQVGQPQSKDTLVYHRPDEKEWGFDGEVTEDGSKLVITVWRGTERKNQVFFQDLSKPDAEVVELISGFDSLYSFLGNDGDDFYFLTDKDAPKRRLIAIDLASPQPEEWREIVPESEDTLRGASYIGGRFCASYLHDAHANIKVFDNSGEHLREVELPGIGSAGGFGGRQDRTETFYYFTNYTTPTTIFHYDVATGESEVFRRPEVDFDPSEYETRQVFFTSSDGTKAPMFITGKKGLKPDGDNPTILYGYGGFNISLTPSFSVSNLVWMEMGGVYAVANLRGGGEYGRPWHEAGMKHNKQNVFDDFIAAAEWLIDNQWTSRGKLAIRGGSNGGLLVGAVCNQRPDLFAAAVPSVGVMDMLRFHKFTIGWAWVNEYGSAEDAEEFRTIYAYSPLHNLRFGRAYPATLITTGDHDDRVVPAHSFKYAAALQATQGGPAPALIRIETRAGHGAGKPTEKVIEESADVLAFLTKTLKIKSED